MVRAPSWLAFNPAPLWNTSVAPGVTVSVAPLRIDISWVTSVHASVIVVSTVTSLDSCPLHVELAMVIVVLALLPSAALAEGLFNANNTVSAPSATVSPLICTKMFFAAVSKAGQDNVPPAATKSADAVAVTLPI